MAQMWWGGVLGVDNISDKVGMGDEYKEGGGAFISGTDVAGKSCNKFNELCSSNRCNTYSTLK